MNNSLGGASTHTSRASDERGRAYQPIISGIRSSEHVDPNAYIELFILSTENGERKSSYTNFDNNKINFLRKFVLI